MDFDLTGDRIDSSVAIGPDGRLYVGSVDQRLYCLDPEGGAEVWSFKTSNGIIVSAPAIASDGTVYFGALNDKLFAFYALTPDGEQLFAVKLPNGVYASPAIGDNGTVYVGCTDGKLYSLGGGGSCEGKDAPVCNDGNACTADSCVEGTGCVHVEKCDDQVRR